MSRNIENNNISNKICIALFEHRAHMFIQCIITFTINIYLIPYIFPRALNSDLQRQDKIDPHPKQHIQKHLHFECMRIFQLRIHSTFCFQTNVAGKTRRRLRSGSTTSVSATNGASSRGSISGLAISPKAKPTMDWRVGNM